MGLRFFLDMSRSNLHNKSIDGDVVSAQSEHDAEPFLWTLTAEEPSSIWTFYDGDGGMECW